KQKSLLALAAVACFAACNSAKEEMEKKDIQLITVAPGHFHAALVQKSMYPDVDSVVHVYAPDGPEADAHLALIDQYNGRAENPTSWAEKVYRGDDFLQKMLEEKKGNVVVLAANNQHKVENNNKLGSAVLNLKGEKAMYIHTDGSSRLYEALAPRAAGGVFFYDFSTVGYEIHT